MCFIVVVAGNSSLKKQSSIYFFGIIPLGIGIWLYVDSSNCLTFDTTLEGFKVLSALNDSSCGV